MIWQESEPGDDVRALLLAAMAHDGRPEIEPGQPLPREFRGGAHLLARVGGELVGYAHLDTGGDAFGNQIAEAIVHPGHRRRGHGTGLVDAVLAKASPKLRVWSHGDHPGRRRHRAAARPAARPRAAQDAARPCRRAARAGLARPASRSARSCPAGTRTSMVAVNKRAFDWHPEQGRLTADEVDGHRAGEPGSTPPASSSPTKDDKIVGFHWTKVHPGDIGEVYVVGVDPAAQGGGLGRALTLAGLHHLREKGLRRHDPLRRVRQRAGGRRVPAPGLHRRRNGRRLPAVIAHRYSNESHNPVLFIFVFTSTPGPGHSPSLASALVPRFSSAPRCRAVLASRRRPGLLVTSTYLERIQ